MYYQPRKKCDDYESIAVRLTQTWPQYFQSRNFDIKDVAHSGHPHMDKIDTICEKVKKNLPNLKNAKISIGMGLWGYYLKYSTKLQNNMVHKH